MKQKIVFAMDEKWKEIKGYPYEISNYGKIKRTEPCQGTSPGKILKPFINRDGYWTIRIFKDTKGKTFLIHRLVMECFIGPCPKGKEVNHMDGDKLNPYVGNLEYVTRSENTKHAYKLGLNKKGELHHNSKFDKNQVLKIRELCKTGKHYQWEIAEMFNVSQSVISQIMCGKTWQHI